jgi:hypothetical protein
MQRMSRATFLGNLPVHTGREGGCGVPSPEAQFWIDIVVKVAGVIGTWAVATIALFGGWLRSKLARLTLALKEPKGLKVPHVIPRGDGSEEQTEARWYFARVENARRWISADGVYIIIISVEQPDASGAYTVRWKGEMPLRWRHGDLLSKKIGYPAECDICCVVKQSRPIVRFHPLIQTDDLQSTFTNEFHMRMTLQAKGIETETEPLVLKIDWDGQWADETEQMAHYFVIKKVERPEPPPSLTRRATDMLLSLLKGIG